MTSSMTSSMTSATSLAADPRAASPSAPRFDVMRVREDFPILQQRIFGKPLAYLDNAASSQKPQAVLSAIGKYYSEDNANVHRGVHLLSQRSTEAYEGARKIVQRFLGARQASEIIWVRGATEAINLVANTFARSRVKEGDEIVISAMEHHSNIVPWQMLCEATGAKLRVAPINDAGEIIVEELERLLGPKVRMLSVVHVSNSLGTINPVKEIVAMAHERGIPVLVDGAQAAPHLAIDVADLDCDFYVFSGHKVYGPTGIGVLYGKAEHLAAMPPYQGGGDMILSVTFEKTIYNEPPNKFEAGTPNIAGAVGLGAALEYLLGLGFDAISRHEEELLAYGTEALGSLRDVRLVGTAARKAAVFSFLMDNVHPHDIGTILDQEGIAVRSGHHCTQPVMERFGVNATVRASLGIYNTTEEVDRLVQGLHRVREVFA